MSHEEHMEWLRKCRAEAPSQEILNLNMEWLMKCRAEAASQEILNLKGQVARLDVEIDNLNWTNAYQAKMIGNLKRDIAEKEKEKEKQKPFRRVSR